MDLGLDCRVLLLWVEFVQADSAVQPWRTILIGQKAPSSLQIDEQDKSPSRPLIIPSNVSLTSLVHGRESHIHCCLVLPVSEVFPNQTYRNLLLVVSQPRDGKWWSPVPTFRVTRRLCF